MTQTLADAKASHITDPSHLAVSVITHSLEAVEVNSMSLLHISLISRRYAVNASLDKPFKNC